MTVDGLLSRGGVPPLTWMRPCARGRRCDSSLARTLLISFVFAIDNLLAGFGLAPVLKQAYGEERW